MRYAYFFCSAYYNVHAVMGLSKAALQCPNQDILKVRTELNSPKGGENNHPIIDREKMGSGFIGGIWVL